MRRRVVTVALLAATAAVPTAAARPAGAWRAQWCVTPRCADRAHERVIRSRRHAAARRRWLRKLRVVRPYRSFFMRVAACESGLRWHLNTGNGFYGGLQFTVSSWHGVGGSGLPHHATRLEQLYRAVRLLHVQGPGAWPVCQGAA